MDQIGPAVDPRPIVPNRPSAIPPPRNSATSTMAKRTITKNVAAEVAGARDEPSPRSSVDAVEATEVQRADHEAPNAPEAPFRAITDEITSAGPTPRRPRR